MTLSGLGIAYANQDVHERIEEFKKTAYGQSFLKSHSEQDLEKVLLFLDNPTVYFPEIRKMQKVADYIDGYDHYLWVWDTGNTERRSFFAFLHNNFQKADANRAAILTFLLLSYGSYGGINAEALTATYAELFRSYPSVLIKEIEKSGHWQLVIDSLFMEWSVFKEGVAKLGSSKFEQEFKAYVREHEEQMRKRGK